MILVAGFTLVDDIRDGLTTQRVIEWDQNTRIVVAALFRDHPLQKRRGRNVGKKKIMIMIRAYVSIEVLSGIAIIRCS